jgi:predicted AAA+ superfamily ATPase
VGIQKDILGTDDLNKIYKGSMIEHLTGQELMACEFNVLSELYFWVKEKKESTAEVDFLIPHQGLIIPIEVKSGKTGTLKSLHQFMDLAPHNMAVRLYAGPFDITEVTTPQNKKYFLLSLPYFLASQIRQYLGWFENEIKEKS